MALALPSTGPLSREGFIVLGFRRSRPITHYYYYSSISNGSAPPFDSSFFTLVRFSGVLTESKPAHASQLAHQLTKPSVRAALLIVIIIIIGGNEDGIITRRQPRLSTKERERERGKERNQPPRRRRRTLRER